MTFIDVIILLVIATILFFIIKSFFKKGKSGCSSCPHCKSCPSKSCTKTKDDDIEKKSDN